jgi:hypothetical protein
MLPQGARVCQFVTINRGFRIIKREMDFLSTFVPDLEERRAIFQKHTMRLSLIKALAAGKKVAPVLSFFLKTEIDRVLLNLPSAEELLQGGKVGYQAFLRNLYTLSLEELKEDMGLTLDNTFVTEKLPNIELDVRATKMEFEECEVFFENITGHPTFDHIANHGTLAGNWARAKEMSNDPAAMQSHFQESHQFIMNLVFFSKVKLEVPLLGDFELLRRDRLEFKAPFNFGEGLRDDFRISDCELDKDLG